MSVRRLGDTPGQRIRRLWHESSDDVVVETKQDVSDIVAISKEQYKENHGAKFSDFQTMVARIPMGIAMELQRRGILDNEERFKAWLNDSDNRVFRTHPGRL